MASPSLQEIVCCMGQPVAGNPTQYMMEKAFAAAGLDWRYLTLEVSPEQLGDAVRGLRAMGFRGANFTIPHKVAVVELLDELSQAARLMGAVNCVHNVGGKLFGENTDGKGFLQALREFVDPAGKHVEILGAGGAARAVAVELALAGAARIDIINRSPQRGEQLAELVAQIPNRACQSRYIPWEGRHKVAADTDILVQATSIGLGDPNAMVNVEPGSLQSGMVVADVVFNPCRTRLLDAAHRQQCTVVDGLGMLVYQGVISFQVWTGIDPDPQVMREAIEEFLGF